MFQTRQTNQNKILKYIPHCILLGIHWPAMIMRAHFVTTRHLTHMYTNTSEERLQCALSWFALAHNQIDHHHLGKQFLES